jgi:hypothetical protein
VAAKLSIAATRTVQSGNGEPFVSQLKCSRVLSVRSRAFGLNLVANQPIPGLVESPAIPADIRLRLGHLPAALRDWEREAEPRLPWYASPHHDASGRPLLTVRQLAGGSFFQFLYGDGTRFVIDRSGSEIWAAWPTALTLADAATYLLGPVLGFVLRLRGRVCLHASAVAFDGAVVAFLGPAGAGKSTTAAAFARRGFPVLCDDVVALAEGPDHFNVSPAYPQLRLWPASVALLYGDADALPPLTPNWDKRGLDLRGAGGRFPDKPLPLAAVYLLGERRDDTKAPYVETLPQAAALWTLVAHTYVNYLLDRTRRAAEFEMLGRLLARVPVRRLIPQAGPARLPQMCDVVVADYQARGR